VVKPAYSQAIYAMRTPDLYGLTAPVLGAQHGVEELMKIHQLVVVSHDSARFARCKAEAIKRYFPINNIVFAKDKSCVRCDILIDDNPKNNPDILLHQPWNMYTSGKWYRANGWTDVVFATRFIDWKKP
jgi:5'(3')-deoxyribonucleotidase